MSHTAAKDANEAIARAAQAIASSDRNLKLAAEYLAFAEAAGKTQRQMAEGVGKSAAWVNRLLQWRRDGYPEDTPFGTQSQERDERHDERVRDRNGTHVQALNTSQSRSAEPHRAHVPHERVARVIAAKDLASTIVPPWSGCSDCSAPATTTKCSLLPAKPRKFAAALGSPGTI